MQFIFQEKEVQQKSKCISIFLSVIILTFLKMYIKSLHYRDASSQASLQTYSWRTKENLNIYSLWEIMGCMDPYTWISTCFSTQGERALCYIHLWNITCSHRPQDLQICLVFTQATQGWVSLLCSSSHRGHYTQPGQDFSLLQAKAPLEPWKLYF